MKKLIIFLLMLLILAGCTSPDTVPEFPATLYYVDKEISSLIPTDVTIRTDNVTDAANELFMLLCSPPHKDLYSALPQTVKLIDLSVSGNECRVTLSPSYLKLSGSRSAALNGALSKTLTSLDGIDRVSIFCEGKSFSFSSDEFLTALPKTFYESHSISLYYPQNNYTGVKKELVTISLSPSETLAEAAVMLLQNPTAPTLESPFPDDCEIYDVYMDGSVCVLNLSGEFVSNAIHKKKQETILLFSIVNTLTELPGIDKVKFLIEGNPSYGYIYYNISTPLRNSSTLFEIGA